jgi:hypothetical protein
MSSKSASLVRFCRANAYFLLLTAVSFVVHAGVSFAIHHADNPSFLDADEQGYYKLAGDLEHNNYTFNLQRTPIHLLVLSVVRVVTFDNLLATQVLVSLIFSLSAPFMYLLTLRLTHHKLFSLSIGFVIMLWPPFLYYGSTLYSETTALPLFIVALTSIPEGSVIRPGAPMSWIRSAVAGMLLGFCVLVRPMYLVFCPLSVAILFLEETNSAVAMRRTALLTAGCLLVVLPWSAYITSKAGTPILVSANGGETLAGGLNRKRLQDIHRARRT